MVLVLNVAILSIVTVMGLEYRKLYKKCTHSAVWVREPVVREEPSASKDGWRLPSPFPQWHNPERSGARTNRDAGNGSLEKCHSRCTTDRTVRGYHGR